MKTLISKSKRDFYQKLRAKLSRWMEGKTSKHKYGEYLLLAPDLFHLLCKLSVDKRIPVAEKAKLATALAYFVSPLDLLPEALLGPLGYADDVVLAAYVLNTIVNTTDPEIVRSQWAGDGDVLEVIQRILEVADDMVGSGLWKILRRMVGGPGTRGTKQGRTGRGGAARRRK